MTANDKIREEISELIERLKISEYNAKQQKEQYEKEIKKLKKALDNAKGYRQP